MNTHTERLAIVLIVLAILLSLDRVFRPNYLSEVMEAKIEGRR